MGCLFAMFAGLFPRLGLFMLWVARPNLVDAAFDIGHTATGYSQCRQVPGYPTKVPCSACNS